MNKGKHLKLKGYIIRSSFCMDNGWVKLHRKMFENDLWLSEPFTKAQAWVDLFANANHCPRPLTIRGNKLTIQRGQIGWSEVTMAKRWKWSRNKVRRFLNDLEMEQQIEQQKDRYITTIITIINYNKYQEVEQQTIQQTIHKQELKELKKKELNTKIASKTTLSLFQNSENPNPQRETKPKHQPNEPITSWKEYLESLDSSPRRDLNIIAHYFREKGLYFETYGKAETAIKRHLRAAIALSPFTDQEIVTATKEAERQYSGLWTIETLSKLLTR